MELSGSVSLGLLSKHGSGRIIKLNNLPNNTMLSADKIRRYECSHDKDDNSIQLLIFCKCTRLFNYFWITTEKIQRSSLNIYSLIIFCKFNSEKTSTILPITHSTKTNTFHKCFININQGLTFFNVQ